MPAVIDRRRALCAFIGLGAHFNRAAMSASKSRRRLFQPAQSHTVLVNSVTSLQSPFALWWDMGGRDYARSVNLIGDYAIEQNEGTIDGVVKQIKDRITKEGPAFVLNIDLGTRYSASKIAAACLQKRVYFVTHGLAPADLDPSEQPKYYVAHIGDDHEMAGFSTGQALVAASKTADCFLALEGPEKDPAAQLRRDGLDRALRNSDAHVAASWAADWDPSAAFDITRFWLLHYREAISGIWAANDPMALGAIEALRVHGLIGKIPVTGIDGHPLALSAIRDGELLATVPRDGFYEGGIGLSLAYNASRGLFDPANEPPIHREFYLRESIVTRETVDDFIQYRSGSEIDVSWQSLWGRVSRGVSR
jgi:ribose transport system substrate-binding protein